MFPTKYKNLFYYIRKTDNKKVYVARYTDPKTSKQVKKTLGTNQRLALSRLNSLQRNEIDTSKNHKEKLDKIMSKMTFTNAYLHYEKVEFPSLSLQEQKTRKSRFKNWILPRFGAYAIDKITYSSIQQFINELDDKNIKKEIKCSRKTQEHFKSYIQAVYTLMIKENIFKGENPAKHVTIKAYDNHVPMTLTKEQISTFYQNIINLDVEDLEVRKKRLMIILMIHGRRLNEARQLEKHDIRLLTNEYVIPAQKSKDKKTHYHKMTKILRYEFMELLLHLKDNETFLFTNPNTNKPYSDISRFFTSLKMSSNIPLSFRTQDFRHVIGTIARKELGMPLEDIRDVLGHGSVKTTEIYSEKNSDNSRTVNNQLFDLFGLVFNEGF